MKKYSFLLLVGLLTLFTVSCSSGPSNEEQDQIASNCPQIDLDALDMLVYEEIPALEDDPQSADEEKLIELYAQRDELIKKLEGARNNNNLSEEQAKQLSEIQEYIKNN